MHAHESRGSTGPLTDAIAVVGVCTAERRAHARALALSRRMTLVPAQQIAQGSHVLASAVGLNALLRGSGGLVVEYPAGTPGHEVVGELADPRTGTALREVVCVVDGMHFWSDLWASDFVPVAQDRVVAYGAARAGGGAEGVGGAAGTGGAHRTGDTGDTGVTRTDPASEAALVARAELLVSQIEFASTVLLTNTRRMVEEDRSLLVALLGHLNPRARVVEDDATGGTAAAASGDRPALTQEQTGPGWVAILNDEFTPPQTHERITALRYVQMRPFHPQRLADCLSRLLTGRDSGQLVRSVGFCRLATRPHVTAQWDHVGGMLSLTPAQHDHALSGDDEPLAFGQDLALIGVGLDPQSVRAELDAAALTNAELMSGPHVWARYRDPLPPWADGGA
jgi:G3E family GTPase